MEVYLNVDQLGRLLSVKRGTLYQWISRGLVPYVKLNGLVRFKQSDIESWLRVKERERKYRNFED